MNHFEEYCTKFVQSVENKDGEISLVITNFAPFAYSTPEIAEGIFDGNVKKPLYSCIENPTTAKFLSISDGLIQISIGLKNPQDIINDFIQAHR